MEKTSQEETVWDTWRQARKVMGSPGYADQQVITEIIQYGSRAAQIVQALVRLIEDKWPDCRTLDAAWRHYGGLAVAEAKKAEARAARQ